MRQRLQSNSSVIKKSRDSRSRQRQIQQAKCKEALQMLSQEEEVKLDDNNHDLGHHESHDDNQDLIEALNNP